MFESLRANHAKVSFWHRVLIHPLELLTAKLSLALIYLYYSKADRDHRQRTTHSGHHYFPKPDIQRFANKPRRIASSVLSALLAQHSVDLAHDLMSHLGVLLGCFDCAVRPIKQSGRSLSSIFALNHQHLLRLTGKSHDISSRYSDRCSCIDNSIPLTAIVPCVQ